MTQKGWGFRAFSRGFEDARIGPVLARHFRLISCTLLSVSTLFSSFKNSLASILMQLICIDTLHPASGPHLGRSRSRDITEAKRKSSPMPRRFAERRRCPSTLVHGSEADVLHSEIQYAICTNSNSRAIGPPLPCIPRSRRIRSIVSLHLATRESMSAQRCDSPVTGSISSSRSSMCYYGVDPTMGLMML